MAHMLEMPHMPLAAGKHNVWPYIIYVPGYDLWPYVWLYIHEVGTEKHYDVTNGATERVAPMTILFHHFDCCWLLWWQSEQVFSLIWFPASR